MFKLTATVTGSTNPIILTSVTLTTAEHDARTIILLDSSDKPLTPKSTVGFDPDAPLTLKVKLFDGDPNAQPPQVPPSSPAAAVPKTQIELRDNTQSHLGSTLLDLSSVGTISPTFSKEMNGATLTLVQKDPAGVNTGKPAEPFTFTLKLLNPPAAEKNADPKAAAPEVKTEVKAAPKTPATNKAPGANKTSKPEKTPGTNKTPETKKPATNSADTPKPKSKSG